MRGSVSSTLLAVALIGLLGCGQHGPGKPVPVDLQREEAALECSLADQIEMVRNDPKLTAKQKKAAITQMQKAAQSQIELVRQLKRDQEKLIQPPSEP